jgi:hypothetical protein
MQIKLSQTLEKHFAGKSPDEIVADIEALIKADIEAKNNQVNYVTLEQFNKLNDQIMAISGNFGNQLANAINAIESKIQTVESMVTETVTNAKAETSRIVAEAIAKSGLNAPIGGQANASQTSDDNSPEAFVALVQEKCKAGLSKATAITQAIKENVKAYSAWRQAGCKPSI